METNTMETITTETNSTQTNIADTKMSRKYFSKLGLILFASTLLIYAVQILAMKLSENVPAIAENGSLSFLVGMLPMYVVAFPIIFLMLKMVPAVTLEKKKMKPLHVFVAFLMTYAATYVCNIIGNVITTIIGVIKQSPVQNVLMEVTSNINPLVNFFIIVICAPIMEELLFRKYLVDRTAKFGEGVAIVFSGLTFGFFHGNLIQFSYAFVLGMFFAFIYVKTGKLIYTIILHMIQNFMGSILGLLVLNKSGFMELAEKLETITDEAELIKLLTENVGGIALFGVYLIFILAIVFAGIIIFIVNAKKFRLNAGEVTIEKGKRFSTVILNLGMILYCVFWIVMIILQLFQ